MKEDLSESRVGARRLLPVITLLLMAPVFGEVLSTATAPLDLLLPWNLALMVGMYGCGALVCRATARRFGFGWPGLLVLGAAYGVYEEGLVDRFWYDPSYWSETGVGDYSVVWHINILTATHLTAFHTAVSIVASIVVVEHLFPDRRHDPWIGTPGTALCGIVMSGVLFVYWEEFFLPPLPVLGAVAVLAGGLVVVAFALPRRKASPAQTSGASKRLGLVAFVCTSIHFVSVYAIPSTGIWWPGGVALSLVPIALGSAWTWHQGRGGLDDAEALRVVTGILSFFLLLNVAFGLAGRYDMTIAALAIGALLWRLSKRRIRDEAVRT